MTLTLALKPATFTFSPSSNHFLMHIGVEDTSFLPEMLHRCSSFGSICGLNPVRCTASWMDRWIDRTSTGLHSQGKKSGDADYIWTMVIGFIGCETIPVRRMSLLRSPPPPPSAEVDGRKVCKKHEEPFGKTMYELCEGTSLIVEGEYRKISLYYNNTLKGNSWYNHKQIKQPRTPHLIQMPVCSISWRSC